MKRLVIAFFLVLGVAFPAAAQGTKTKMTIATGVDPSLGTFYVAKVGGFFDKHGLDVQLNTGPSGSAMVAFLVQNQVQAVLAAEQAGIQNFNLDNNVTVACRQCRCCATSGWSPAISTQRRRTEGQEDRRFARQRQRGVLESLR